MTSTLTAPTPARTSAVAPRRDGVAAISAVAATFVAFATAILPVGGFPVRGVPLDKLPIPADALPPGVPPEALAMLGEITIPAGVLRHLMAWPLLSYVVAFAVVAVAVLAAGRLGMPTGQRALAPALLVFGVANLVNAYTTTDTVLVLARATAGAAAAFVVVAALAVLLDAIAPELMMAVAATWWLIVASAIALSPILGSVLLAHAGLSVTAVCTGLACVATLLALLTAWSVSNPSPRHQDVTDVVLPGVTTTAVAAAITMVNPSIYMAALVVVCALIAVAGLRMILLIARTRRTTTSTTSPAE